MQKYETDMHGASRTSLASHLTAHRVSGVDQPAGPGAAVVHRTDDPVRSRRIRGTASAFTSLLNCGQSILMAQSRAFLDISSKFHVLHEALQLEFAKYRKLYAVVRCAHWT